MTCKIGDKADKVFGKGCIVFAMRNKENEVTGLYFKSITNDKGTKRFYQQSNGGSGWDATNTTSGAFR